MSDNARLTASLSKALLTAREAYKKSNEAPVKESLSYITGVLEVLLDQYQEGDEPYEEEPRKGLFNRSK